MKLHFPSRCIALVAACAALVATPASAAFTSLTVFGDSLSDTGNNALVIGANGSQVISGNTYIPTQPYAFGTYSNQGVWVSTFAAGLGLPAGAVPSLGGGGNYAYGGARTTVDGTFMGFPPSAATQLSSYLATPGTIASSALFVIAIGGNDVRSTAEAVAADPANALSIISAAAGNFALGVGNMVDALQARGAQNIVVWGAPDVGRTPFALATGGSAGGSFISGAFNSALGARLAGEAGVTGFDVAGLVNSVVANPAAYGLLNVTDACGAVVGCNASQYLFWDGIHPTSAGQALLGQAMLAAVPEPAAAPMLLLGVLAVVAATRRRRAAR